MNIINKQLKLLQMDWLYRKLTFQRPSIDAEEKLPVGEEDLLKQSGSDVSAPFDDGRNFQDEDEKDYYYEKMPEYCLEEEDLCDQLGLGYNAPFEDEEQPLDAGEHRNECKDRQIINDAASNHERLDAITYSCELKCGPCNYESVTKSATMWCTDCEESFCDECLRTHKASKIARNHHIIPAKDDKKIEGFQINLECHDHNRQFDFFCPTHDSVICLQCLQLKHVSCKDFKPLEEAAKGAKSSTALSDLEQTINGILENIEKGERHILQSETNLKEQEQTTIQMISKKREEINQHLDRIEKMLLGKLRSKAEEATKELFSMALKLAEKRTMIVNLKETIFKMKQYSSNLKVFVGTRSIMHIVVKEMDKVKPLVINIPEFIVEAQIFSRWHTFTADFDSLGEIEVTSKAVIVPYSEQRLIQAQYRCPKDPGNILHNLQLNLNTMIKLDQKSSDVTSCMILPNKSLMIVSRNKASLTILKEDGSPDCDISVPYNPYDVTTIDDQRVAISYGTGYTCISIVNLNNQLIEKTLLHLCMKSIYGISYSGGKLYAVAYKEGIKVVDLDGKVINTIRIFKDASYTFKVTTQKDKLFYSVGNGSVYCTNMEGTEIWRCQDDRLLKFPAIAADNYGTTFAVGYTDSLVLAISQDGKQHKALLTSSDEIKNPTALYFDKDSNRLMVCNENRRAAIYDVMYNYYESCNSDRIFHDNFDPEYN